MHRGLVQMLSDLGEKHWCVGDRYTLADIAVGCCLGWLGFRKPAGIDWRAEYPGLARHYDKLMERPAFAESVPSA
jgi:glutathione S-transferase